jgi:hypothetical protein
MANGQNGRAKDPTRVGIGEAVVAELHDISLRRGIKEDPQRLNPHKWVEHCHEKKLFGISISGGGIRSATFGLGILQGLVEKNLLSKADYISTVSGGGYIGAWLQEIACRYKARYEKILEPERVPDLAAKDPITFLRKYSNYLAPRNGLSLDALVIPLIWLRNMMLNQAIIISAFMALFIVVLTPGAALRRMALEGTRSPSMILLVGCAIAALICVLNVGPNLRKIAKREFSAEPDGAQQVEAHISLGIAVPLFLSVLFLIFGISAKEPATCLGTGLLSGFFVLWGLLILLQINGGFVNCYCKQRESIGKQVNYWRPWFHVFWMSFATALFLLSLLAGVWFVSSTWNPATAYGSQLVIAWMPSLYLLAIVIGIGLHIGLMGRDFPDASREWLARVAALLVTFLAIWAGVFALGVFAPLGIAKLWLRHGGSLASGVGAWILSTVMSALAANSGKSGALNVGHEKQSSTIDWIARYGPFIAVPGFLAAVAFATEALLHPIPWKLESFVAHYWKALPYSRLSWVFPMLFLAFLVLVFLLLSWRVNINEFSMHHFYKNRLVRCYLGASATQTRMPDLFTGFDPKDDVPLYKLRYDEGSLPGTRVPYPIINAALTVTAGTELATQERKALPWFFSPLYSGFYPARCDADRVERDTKHMDPYADSRILSQGLSLGTATAISGAAVNPNWGYHSAPQTAFLLTLFNVRLGWWLGNPRKKKNYFASAGPTFALWWLFRELFGFVDEGSRFLNLSDGGHFENLGLYELVRRRCRYVIVIDGEEDPEYRFESLGGAVRKCRNDFGIEIEIDPRPISPHPQFSQTHCVVGRINYPRDENAEPGWLLYLKSSITGNEPTDVEEYRRLFPVFPQQSTGDQFFSESQFESYRRLGLHVARSALDHIGPDLQHRLEDVFGRLERQWQLPPLTPEGAFAHHAEAYTKILDELTLSPDLKNLDSVIVGELPSGGQSPAEQRHTFFLYLKLLQLIEDVFLDMDFSNAYKWNHPGTAGWKRLITYWAKQPGITEVWAVQKDNYGQPFRDFFDDLVHERQAVDSRQQQ